MYIILIPKFCLLANILYITLSGFNKPNSFVESNNHRNYFKLNLVANDAERHGINLNSFANLLEILG
jgi:hypothetical protein